MICNPSTDSMQQSRHNFSKQNCLLMKFRRKIVAHWARLPSKALITREMRVSGSVNKLHIIVNKNYLQHVGLGSSEQRRKVDWYDRVSSCTFLDFHRMRLNERIWSEGLLPMNRIDVMKQVQAFLSIKGLPASSCPDSHPPTTETAIFVKSNVKSDCSHLQEALYKLVPCTTSLVVQDTRLQSRRAAARRAAARHAFRVWIGEF
jgi:hypothetical protein